MTTTQSLAIAIGILTTVSALSGPAEIVIPAIITPQTTDLLESWLAAETSYALDGVFNNIGPDGAKATGAGSGIVIASPGQSNPDCRSLVETTILGLEMPLSLSNTSSILFAADIDPALQRIIEEYIDSQALLQTAAKLDGNEYSGITPLWYGTVMLDAGEEFEFKHSAERWGWRGYLGTRAESSICGAERVWCC